MPERLGQAVLVLSTDSTEPDSGIPQDKGAVTALAETLQSVVGGLTAPITALGAFAANWASEIEQTKWWSLAEQSILPLNLDLASLRPTLELGLEQILGCSLEQLQSAPSLGSLFPVHPEIDDRFLADRAAREAETMLSPNASPEERSAAWKSMNVVVREWLHISHRRFGSDSSTHQIVRQGRKVTIYTPWDGDFAISDVIEIAATELRSGRWTRADSPRDYLHAAVTKEVSRRLNGREGEQRLLQELEQTNIEIGEEHGSFALLAQAEPVADVSEVIEELCADDPEADQVALAKYVDGVPIADLPAHLGWPKLKTQSALRRMYRKIKKAGPSGLRGSTALQGLRPTPARQSGKNIVAPTVPPKVGDFYCSGGTARWERLESGLHVWTHGTDICLEIPSGKAKTS